ncbi:MAG: YkgJ family cysteine cluster protein [Myxococcota bacterium]|jgi:Fe-S-cluster containining protein|nr:YkgJ family cysteine cluster protein [Myxococcota bacterium]
MAETRDWLFSNCTACPSIICCYTYNVNILGWDAYRIARRRHLPYRAFLGYVEQEEPDSTSFRLQVDGPPYMLTLLKRAAGARPEGWPCAWLLDLPGDVHRCGLYEERPLVCRIYPGALYEGVAQFRRETVCPWPVYDIGKIDLRRWKGALLDNRVEKDIYEAVLAIWNARVFAADDRPHSLDELFRFLLNVYHRTEAFRPTSPAQWRRVRSEWSRLLDVQGSPLLLAPNDPAEAALRDESHAALWRLAAGIRQTLRELAP